ncbi:unnamed protein product, partial [Pleuronectes platessa]
QRLKRQGTSALVALCVSLCCELRPPHNLPALPPSGASEKLTTSHLQECDPFDLPSDPGLAARLHRTTGKTALA